MNYIINNYIINNYNILITLIILINFIILAG